MRRRRKIRLRYKKERVVFSDVLPYELPIIFSNRYFYRFLIKYGVYAQREKDGGFVARWRADIPDSIRGVLAVLFQEDYNALKGKVECKLKQATIPFVYSIRHKPSKARRLAVMHPADQIKVVEFYDKYKDAIIHLSSKSSFSIRRPQKVASYFFYKDRLHHILLGKKMDSVEMFFNEYENLKTFFSYKDYTNVYKFYEHYRYQRAEKKFSHLLRLDIQTCFESIYTHSIAWAINGGVDSYKDTFRGKDGSIGEVWDGLMQGMNYQETNGIIIGPEFSRLFAEVILQYVDQRVEQELLLKHEYRHKVDYECYRYVDDYFFFYNNEEVKGKAVCLLEDFLKEFKLSLSQEKMHEMERPFITNITKAKLEIDPLIQEYIRLHQDTIVSRGPMSSEEDDTDDVADTAISEQPEDFLGRVDADKVKKSLESKVFFKLRATEFNAKFKAICEGNGVASKDVANYTIACIASRIEKSLKAFDRIYKPLAFAKAGRLLKGSVCDEGLTKKLKHMEKMLSSYLYEVIDVLFFIHSGSRRVNTSLKVFQALNHIIVYLDNHYQVGKKKDRELVIRFSEYARELVFKKIHDEVALLFSYDPIDSRLQLETLYFLIILRSLNRKYRLSSSELSKYLRLGGSAPFSELNAIALIVLLYYMGNNTEFISLKKELIQGIKDKYNSTPEVRRRKMAEFAILTLDLATCPFVERGDKLEFLKLMGLEEDQAEQARSLLEKQKFMFTKWTGVNVTKELSAKISQEVYS